MTPAADIPLGSKATKSVEVTRELTVAHFHSGMPEVYGTPMMIYLMEVAAAAAVDAHLPEGWVSVGAAINVSHLAPTPVGLTVTATATVVSTDDRRVVLAVVAHDDIDKIGEGTHTRMPVELSRLQKGIDAKSALAGK